MIRVDGVRFAYEADRPVLSGLSLHARGGEIVGLLGANGAGKTTTFSLLAGLLRPDEGEIEIAGVSVLAEPRATRRLSAYLPDEPMLYPTLSALENLDMFGRLWEVPAATARVRGEELLREVGLWEVRNQWARTYSRGMRQKLALAAALLHKPRVILMDEPFTGLDVAAALWARRLLRRFADDGGCILLTSHVPELIEVLADQVAVLHRGTVAYYEDRETVRSAGGVVAVFERIWDGDSQAMEPRACAAS